jgi:transcriptional antiterminator NusG
MDNVESKWYILNVMAGQENNVANDIKTLILKSPAGKFITEVLVPTKPVFKIKKGQKVQELQKIFPGYVFVNANLNSDAYNMINSVQKVMGFLGGKNNPQPVSQEKMDEILNSTQQLVADNKNLNFDIGETLKINEGPFESFTGVVEDYDAEKQKIKISVLIFGRATSVELDVNQVEKVS